MQNLIRILTGALLVIVATGATTKLLGSADGEMSGSRVDVTELKRVSAKIISLKFVLENNSNSPITIGEDFSPTGSPTEQARDNNTISGVYLEDLSGPTKYYVARDDKGNCVCSSDIPSIKPKSKMTLWARFPAPPGDVAKMNVVVPHFQPVEDVPLTK